MWSSRGSSSAELPAAEGDQQRFSQGRGCGAELGPVRARAQLPSLKHHDNTAPMGLSQESSRSCTSISGREVRGSRSGPKLIWNAPLPHGEFLAPFSGY